MTELGATVWGFILFAVGAYLSGFVTRFVLDRNTVIDPVKVGVLYVAALGHMTLGAFLLRWL